MEGAKGSRAPGEVGCEGIALGGEVREALLVGGGREFSGAGEGQGGELGAKGAQALEGVSIGLAKATVDNEIMREV